MLNGEVGQRAATDEFIRCVWRNPLDSAPAPHSRRTGDRICRISIAVRPQLTARTCHIDPQCPPRRSFNANDMEGVRERAVTQPSDMLQSLSVHRLNTERGANIEPVRPVLQESGGDKGTPAHSQAPRHALADIGSPQGVAISGCGCDPPLADHWARHGPTLGHPKLNDPTLGLVGHCFVVQRPWPPDDCVVGDLLGVGKVAELIADIPTGRWRRSRPVLSLNGSHQRLEIPLFVLERVDESVLVAHAGRPW